MVKLDKIYTTGGDSGETSLGNGKRVKKTDRIIIAVGSVEELNAHIGLALATSNNKYNNLLSNIQNDLFDLGADLVVPQSDIRKKKVLRITNTHVAKVEKYIDDINANLPPLKSFILRLTRLPTFSCFTSLKRVKLDGRRRKVDSASQSSQSKITSLIEW